MSDKESNSPSGPEPLKVDAETWSQRRLIHNIVSRYFDVVEDIGDLWPTWVVRSRIDDEMTEDPHLALEALNKHLKELDWMARLSRDDPWRIQVVPSPSGLFALEAKHRAFFWLSALISTWVMGVVWVLPLHDGSHWYDPELLRAGLFSYALPVMAVIAMADLAQRYVAAKLDMRIGGLLPIAIPIPYPAWPFALKRRIKQTQNGYNLLKMKRDGLFYEFRLLLSQMIEAKRALTATYRKASGRIALAAAIEGGLEVQSAALGNPVHPEVEVSRRNIMGVVVPKVEGTNLSLSLVQRGTGLIGGSAYIDEAADSYGELIEKIVKAAEMESTLKRLLVEIEATKRRVNALEFKVIPEMEEARDFIQLRLEEMEREETFRLKRFKNKK